MGSLTKDVFVLKLLHAENFTLCLQWLVVMVNLERDGCDKQATYFTLYLDKIIKLITQLKQIFGFQKL